MLIDFREGKGERERGTETRYERETVTGCLAYTQLGTEPAAQACALTGQRPSGLQDNFNQLSHTSQIRPLKTLLILSFL